MKRLNKLWPTLTLALIFAVLCWGQSASAKKSYTFHGKVESVDPSEKSLKVKGEKVEGWMGAMTMDYKVDDPAVLKKVKAGDQITATVYDGDFVLHKVEVVPSGSSSSKTK